MFKELTKKKAKEYFSQLIKTSHRHVCHVFISSLHPYAIRSPSMIDSLVIVLFFCSSMHIDE